MRLVHNLTYNIVEFTGSHVPPYAILSHTWGEDEVSLPDMIGGDFEDRKGFQKIKRCCTQAIADGYKYSWIDTCCIDKTSSAELSEAINSMFQWYERSGICYAFLSDADGSLYNMNSPSSCCRWFTRSWTLQELLAPASVVFYDRNWVELGTANSLANQIAHITKLPVSLFVFEREIYDYSVADRLSWAAERQATRVEDRAYSLLGLFKINMPLLYGEGNQAFIRLQRKIIKSSRDLSIFAWSSPFTFLETKISWLLADCIDDFKDSRHIGGRWYHDYSDSYKGPYPPTSLTYYEMELSLPLHIGADTSESLVYLGCKVLGEDKHFCVQLYRQDGGYWLRHPQITILERNAAYMRQAFHLTRLKFDSVKREIVLDLDVVGFRRSSVSMRMPTLYLSISGNAAVKRLRAHLRLLFLENEAQTKTESVEFRNEAVQRMNYSVFAMTWARSWVATAGLRVVDIDRSQTGTNNISIILRPDNGILSFFSDVDDDTFVITALEILDNCNTVTLLVIGMKGYGRKSHVFASEVPIKALYDAESLWRFDPPMQDALDTQDLVAFSEAGKKRYQVLVKIRPRGCDVHDHQCECRPCQVTIHVAET